MYAAYGFKFQTDQEACKYFNIDYNDFVKWQKSNTGGWSQVENYPKDAALELTLDIEFVDPYKLNVHGGEEEEEESTVQKTTPHWYLRMISET